MVEWRAVDGEVVALDLRTKTYLAINDTGAAIWAALVRGASREALVWTLVEMFEVPKETAQGDLDTFLEQLAAHDILEKA
jgi:hypothetical protein